MIDTSKIPASRLKQETFDNKPQDGSGNVISSGAVYNALKPKPMLTATLSAKPTPEFRTLFFMK